MDLYSTYVRYVVFTIETISRYKTSLFHLIIVQKHARHGISIYIWYGNFQVYVNTTVRRGMAVQLSESLPQYRTTRMSVRRYIAYINAEYSNANNSVTMLRVYY